jgi:hypothetical protein
LLRWFWGCWFYAALISVDGFFMLSQGLGKVAAAIALGHKVQGIAFCRVGCSM